MASSTQFVETLLANSAALQEIMAAFHGAEDAADGPEAQKIPYFRWQHSLTEQQTRHLTQISNTALSDGDADAATVALATGLRMRLSQTSQVDEVRIKKASAALKDTSDKTVLYEAGNILRAITAWAHLEDLCDSALPTFERGDVRLNVVADWYVLARYRQMVRKFEVNRLSESDINDFESLIDRLAGAIGPDSKNTAFYRSILATLRNDLIGAVDWILKAQKLPGKLIVLFQRLESFCALDDLMVEQTPAHAALAQTLDHHFLHAADGGPVLLLSADSAYVQRYFDKLCESFGYWNPDGLIHLHCVGFSLDDTVRQTLEHNHGVRINFTVDRQPAIEADEQLFPGYCANARYLFLPYYLAHYQKVTVTDIDGVIRRPIADLWRKDDDAIRLTTKILDENWDTTRLLWEAIAAGSLVISHTPENTAFAWRVANYLAGQIAICRERGMKLFYTDQIGLMLGYLASQNTCTFKPLSGLYRQRGRWAFGGGGTSRAAHQQALDYKSPDKPVAG